VQLSFVRHFLHCFVQEQQQHYNYFVLLRLFELHKVLHIEQVQQTEAEKQHHTSFEKKQGLSIEQCYTAFEKQVQRIEQEQMLEQGIEQEQVLEEEQVQSIEQEQQVQSTVVQEQQVKSTA